MLARAVEGLKRASVCLPLFQFLSQVVVFVFQVCSDLIVRVPFDEGCFLLSLQSLLFPQSRSFQRGLLFGKKSLILGCQSIPLCNEGFV